MIQINKKQKGFSIPEVIVAISIVVLIIMTATNLLVSSMRANRNNVNRIIAYNLAQEALEGVRNIRDGNWLQNQYWRGNGDYAFFGEPFVGDGNYIIQKKHALFSKGQCGQGADFVNDVDTVTAASPWELALYNDEKSKLYIRESDYTEYTHEPVNNFSGFKRWVEIETVPYEGGLEEDTYKLKLNVTAVVEWEERSREQQLRIPMILTDWKSGTM
ncbi:prepilin-type N-terminal cleavage/methylation domain-containing protein [Candidatus Peregrinibacteria bacterium]|nr:prepilin-type N-terminal cleavage/methylation domain-containing protein [Candidatus Peregrinibacteria bacterium]